MLFTHDLFDQFAKSGPGDFNNALEGRYTEDDKAQRERLEKYGAVIHLAGISSASSTARHEPRRERGPAWKASRSSATNINIPVDTAAQSSTTVVMSCLQIPADFNRLHPASKLARGGGDFDFSGGRFNSWAVVMATGRSMTGNGIPGRAVVQSYGLLILETAKDRASKLTKNQSPRLHLDGRQGPGAWRRCRGQALRAGKPEIHH